MTAKPTYRWHRLRAGAHTMTSWIGDTQCTYVAKRTNSGWVLTRSVAGAETVVLGELMPTLRAAKIVARADLDSGLL